MVKATTISMLLDMMLLYVLFPISAYEKILDRLNMGRMFRSGNSSGLGRMEIQKGLGVLMLN